MWRRKNPHAADLSFDENFKALDIGPESNLVEAVYPDLRTAGTDALDMSTEEMERLLEFQIEKLQSKIDNMLLCMAH
jgi:hypothetical protein